MNNVLTTLYNGLFYGGNIFHTIFNYGLIAITMIPFLLTKFKRTILHWKWIMMIAILLQATFWFILSAQGVSIIWNTLLGVLILVAIKLKKEMDRNKKILLYSSIIAPILADVYYAITFPIITTIAHIAAIFLGMGLYRILKK